MSPKNGSDGGKQRSEINIGIAEKDRREISEGLKRLLADTYTVYIKTHNYHWNVTGPMFQSLHGLFETQYTELALAVDLVAERIRALGFRAPGSYSEFSELTSIKENTKQVAAEQMLRDLVESNEAVIRTARSILDAAESANDQSTLDILTQRLEVHEKAAWMLRSMLG